MSRRRIHDYRSMSVEELRVAVREGQQQERAARYSKGRRSWKTMWEEAEAELARRGLSA